MQSKISYWEKLQDPRWQKKRLEIFERDKFACRDCGETSERLEIHHEYYISKREPWDYPDEAFKTLCSTCHRSTTFHGMVNGLAWEELVPALQEAQDKLAQVGERFFSDAGDEAFKGKRHAIWVALLCSFARGKIPEVKLQRWMKDLELDIAMVKKGTSCE